MQNILIEFSSNTKGIETADEALTKLAGTDKKLADETIKTNNALKEQMKHLESAGGSVKNMAEKLQGAGKLAASAFGTKALKDFEKVSLDAFKKMISGSKDVNKALKTIETELKAGVNDALKAAGVSAAEFEQALDEVGISAEEFADFLAEGVLSSEAFEQAIQNAGSKTKTFKQELKELKTALAQMEAEGQRGTETFNAMVKRAAQLEDQIGDTNAQIRALASDTGNIDAALQGINALAAGFQIAEGASALFGEENEELQKTLVKLNAVMAVTQGIQQVSNALNKDSALIVKGQVAWNGILSTSNRLAAATYAGLGISVTATSTAMKVLRTVIISTGIGALVAGIGFAVAKIIEWKEANDEAKNSMEGLTTEIDRQRTSLEAYNKTLDRSNSLEQAILRSRGASETELLKAQQQNIGLKNRAARANLADLNDKLNEKRTIDGLVVSYGELNRLNERGEAKGIFSEGAIQAAKDVADAVKEATNNVDDLQTHYEELTFAISKAEKDAFDEQEKKRLASAQRSAKALFEIRKRAIEQERDLFSEAASDENNPFSLRLLAAQQYYKASLQLLEVQKEEELSQQELTGQEIANIKDKYQKLQLVAEHAFFKQRRQLAKVNNDQELQEAKEQQEALLAADEARFNRALSSIEKLYAGINAGNATEKNKFLQNLQDQFNGGLIDLNTYEEKRAAVIADFTGRELGNEIKKLEAIRSLRAARGEDVTAINQAIYAAEDQRRQNDLAAHKTAEQKKTEATKEEEEKRNAIRKSIGQAALQILTSVANAYYEGQALKRQQELDDAVAKLNARKEAELRVKNITEQQKDDINRRYAAKERQLKLRAFDENKKAKRAQALVSAALAIIQAYAQLGPIYGSIAAAGVVAATGFQIDKINKATPGFKKGKVNIDGPGTTTSDSINARISKGESVINAEATGRYEDALRAINEFRFEDYLAKMAPQFASQMVPPVAMTALPDWAKISHTGGQEIDYDKLGKVIADNMKDPVINQINLDEEGFNINILKAGNRQKILNKRYKL